MTKDEFTKIRLLLGKTQSQTAQLIGCSLKAIQSFEQGFRRVPVHVERQLLFLLSSLKPSRLTCWEIKECPIDLRRYCPAWEFQLGNLCWFVNGTICRGETQETWEKKIRMCRRCDVFKSMLPDLSGASSKRPDLS
jgi:DNA-binding XRE family transcriptional regulator